MNQDIPKPPKLPIGGDLKAVQYIMSIAGNIGPRRLAETVRSKNTCKACAFGTGGPRGGLHNEHNPAREPGLLRFASPSNFRSMIIGGAAIASHYVQSHIGGDFALLQGLAKAIMEENGQDDAYIIKHVNGFDAYKAHLDSLEWEQLSVESGAEIAQIREIAQLTFASKNAVWSWGMGITHHTHGVENVEAISNLALFCGLIGRPGSGLLPLRGHSNVQGVGSMGVTPALKEKVFASIEAQLGVSLPTGAGMDTLACMRAAHAGDIDFAFLLGGNLYAANPDSTFADAALAAIPFKVQISSTLNLSHVHGIGEESIVLPIRVRGEETQSTTQESMFNYVRLSDGGFDRIESLRSEVELISVIASRVIAKDTLDFAAFLQHQEIRKIIAKVIPGYEALEQIDKSKQEFHVEGRLLATPRFATSDRRANFRVPSQHKPHATQIRGKSEYILTSVRSEGQFNTIIYNDKDVYRGQTSRNIVLMNPFDMRAEGLTENTRVNLSNATGKMTALQVKPFDIRQGNLMTYFPEANVLIPLTSDPRSQTPAFKAVTVKIEEEAD